MGIESEQLKDKENSLYAKANVLYDKVIKTPESLIVYESNKCGILCRQSHVAHWYDHLSYVQDQMYVAKERDKCGVIDKNNNIVADFLYSDIVDISNNFVVAALAIGSNNSYGIFKLDGTGVVPFINRHIDVYKCESTIYHISDAFTNTLWDSGFKKRIIMGSQCTVVFTADGAIIIEFKSSMFSGKNAENFSLTNGTITLEIFDSKLKMKQQRNFDVSQGYWVDTKENELRILKTKDSKNILVESFKLIQKSRLSYE